MLGSPGWLAALMRDGRPIPEFGALAAEKAGDEEIIRFAGGGDRRRLHLGRDRPLRDRWRKPHGAEGRSAPLDAAKAVAIGIEGIWVSNHGGRRVEALPPAIDVLPAIATEVGSRTTPIMDSGIRSGTDVVRAAARGAQSTFAGKAFLWGLGALGRTGRGT